MTSAVQRGFRAPVLQLLLTAAAVASAVCAASPVSAQPTAWTAGTGDWFTPGNWSAGVPTFGNGAYVANGGTAQIATDGATGSLTVGGDTDGVAGGATGNGSVIQSIGAAQFAAFRLGETAGTTGTYQLQAGTLQAIQPEVGSLGNGSFTHDGGLSKSNTCTSHGSAAAPASTR